MSQENNLHHENEQTPEETLLQEERSKDNGEIEEKEAQTPTEQVEKNDTQSSEDKVKQLETALAEQKDNYLRLYADFENFRRRTAKEKIEFLEQANAKLLVELLPVFDDFERALKSFENPDLQVSTAKEGIQLIYQKFQKFLEKQGLVAMESNQQDFDPDKHEAIAQVPAPSEDLKGKIIDTVEKGYFLGEKVVRFAKVVTGN
ncbi:MAG: nucleotide exchange factor GrpE [Raineya sp.]